MKFVAHCYQYQDDGLEETVRIFDSAEDAMRSINDSGLTDVKSVVFRMYHLGEEIHLEKREEEITVKTMQYLVIATLKNREK